jgi:hypothetical protein
MASLGAAAARLEIEGRGDALDQYVPEGEEMEFPLKGPSPASSTSWSAASARA